MAQLSGHLTADFSSFTKAVDTAVTQLKGFESNAGKVGDSLQKMTDKFQGNKFIQDAVLMAKAVEQIGGASKLTDTELQKLGKTAAEAVQKMERLGVEVPAGLREIADSAKAAEKSTFDWKTALTSAAGAFGIAFSVNALKNFAVGVIDAGAAIGDMSEKLGISAEAVQRFGYAADQSGADITTVDSAIKKMNANLAEGSKSTIAALTEAGLRFEDIRRMAPEQAFIAIGDAVARIEDPMVRARVATELFGKAGQELIPTFLAGIRTVGDQTAVMADDTVRRLKEAQDAWGRFKNAVVVASGEWLATAQKDAQSWVDTAAKLGAPFRLVRDALQDTSAASRQTASDVGAMVATLTPGLTGLAANGLKPVALNAEQVDVAIGYMNATLVKVPEISKAAAKEAEALASSLERVRYTQFQLGQHAVAASQNVTGFGVRMSETVAINRDFSAELTASTIHLDHFGHVVATNVAPSLGRMGQGLIDVTENTADFRTNIGLLSQSFANLGQIGGAGLSAITRGIGSVIGGLDVGMKSLGTFKSGFADLGKGNMLSGIASITSGIGGIVSAAMAAIQAVKALWSWAKGGEEGQVVNPARDTWFAGRSVQDIGDQLAPFMSGDEARKLISDVFNAKTKQDFGAASGTIDRILAGQNSFAGGSGGFRDFGAGTLAMLHGKEAVVPAGGSLGGSVVIQINAQGAFFDTPGDLQRLADKVNDALTARHGLTNRARAA